jgi:phytoene dehydrogenase-like protein
MIELLRVLPMSVRELLDDTFEDETLKAAVAPGGVIDHAQGPRSGATGYVFHHYLVGAESGVVRGRAPWKGGPQAFTRAVEAAARSAGVTIRTGASVARVEVRDDGIAGVTLEGGETVATSRVLSTVDPRRTLLGWVDPVWLDPDFLNALGNVRYRGCAAVVAYGLDELPIPSGLAREALGGMLSLTPDLDRLERAADAAKYGQLSERAHVELTVPTFAAPDLAPAGKHVVIARTQYAPYRLRDGAWDAARRERLADHVTETIGGALPGFASRVRHRAAWTPLDLEERFGLTEGAPTHGELGLDQILFMRPVAGWGRHTTPIRGLYLGGAGTHPGPGILGGAGRLAARRLLSERNGKGSR